MKYFLTSVAVLLAGCSHTLDLTNVSRDDRAGRPTPPAELTDTMRYDISQLSFVQPIRVDLTDGQTLYLAYVTFHADSLHFSCAKPERWGCRLAKPTDSGGSLGLSNVAAVEYEAKRKVEEPTVGILLVPVLVALLVSEALSSGGL